MQFRERERERERESIFRKFERKRRVNDLNIQLNTSKTNQNPKQQHTGAGQGFEMAANVMPLLTNSSNLLAEKQQNLFLETENRNVLIFRLSNGASLVCVCKRTLGEKILSVQDYLPQCCNAVSLLEKGFFVFFLFFVFCF